MKVSAFYIYFFLGFSLFSLVHILGKETQSIDAAGYPIGGAVPGGEKEQIRCQVWAGGVFHKSFQDVLVGRGGADMI